MEIKGFAMCIIDWNRTRVADYVIIGYEKIDRVDLRGASTIS